MTQRLVATALVVLSLRRVDVVRDGSPGRDDSLGELRRQTRHRPRSRHPARARTPRCGGWPKGRRAERVRRTVARLTLLAVDAMATDVAHTATPSVRRRQIARRTHHVGPCAAPRAPPTNVPRHRDGRRGHRAGSTWLVTAYADGGFDTDHATVMVRSVTLAPLITQNHHSHVEGRPPTLRRTRAGADVPAHEAVGTARGRRG